MRTNFNGLQNSMFLNMQRMNQSLAKNNGDSAVGSAQKQGSKAKVESPLESLMKQKEALAEQRSELIGNTLEKGGTLDSIKTQLNAYDEKAKNIDKQISDLMTKEMVKQTEQVNNKKESKPMTEEEIQNDWLKNTVNLAGNIGQLKIAAAVKSRLESSSRILKSEIRMDKMSAGTTIGTNNILSKKEKTLAAMEEKTVDLSSQIEKGLEDVNGEGLKYKRPEEIVPEKEKPEVDPRQTSRLDSDK